MVKLFGIHLNYSWLPEIALGAGEPEPISVHYGRDSVGRWTGMEAIPMLYGAQYVAGLLVIRSVQTMSSTELTI